MPISLGNSRENTVWNDFGNFGEKIDFSKKNKDFYDIDYIFMQGWNIPCFFMHKIQPYIISIGYEIKTQKVVNQKEK